jgi:hypothetical protein
LESKRSKQNDEKRVFCFDAKRLKRNSEKIRSETMRNEAKNFFFGFAKTCENLKRGKKGHPTLIVAAAHSTHMLRLIFVIVFILAEILLHNQK